MITKESVVWLSPICSSEPNRTTQFTFLKMQMICTHMNTEICLISKQTTGLSNPVYSSRQLCRNRGRQLFPSLITENHLWKWEKLGINPLIFRTHSSQVVTCFLSFMVYFISIIDRKYTRVYPFPFYTLWIQNLESEQTDPRFALL